MSKRKSKTSFSRAKYVSIFLFVFSIIGLLGGKFKIIIGKQIYNMLAAILGSMAWVGLILCLILAFFIWKWSDSLFSPGILGGSRDSKSRDKQGEQNHTEIAAAAENEKINSGIPLPEGKLVNLQGFNKYFVSPEWVEIKDNEISEEMKELGNNFPSYFGRGESVHPHKPQKLTVLNGLAAYIEEVDQEEKPVPETSSQDNLSPSVPDLGTLNPEPFSSVFKSQKEQEEFLAQFKVADNLFVKIPREDKENEEGNEDKINDVVKAGNEILDYIENLQDLDRPLDETMNIRQVIEPVDSATLNSPEALPKAAESISAENVLEFVDSEAELPEIEDLQESPQSNEPSETDLQPSGRADYPDTYVSNLDIESKTGQDTQSVDALAKEDVAIPQASPQIQKNNWQLPDLNLLDLVPESLITDNPETSKQLEQVLLDFGVKAKVVYVTRGPVITRYELVPAPGVKISKIVNLADDIALGLAARDVRIEAPIPGKAAIGIEVPNKKARSVPFREVLETDGFGQYPSKLKVALGKDIANQPIIADLIKMPHLLVAGATGSGKSVCITTIINSILFNATPDEVKFLLVDPKMVELSLYNGIPHLLAPVVVDPKKAAGALKWIVKEMENRYELFAAAGVRDIDRYNRLKAEECQDDIPALPLIVVIIDELADLMLVAAGDVEEAICRLAQMARAAGIHLVIATQRPSVDVITGVIKANIPSRISFAVSSQIDSRTILDATGAEKLLGRGDMLYSPLGKPKPLRVQGCLVTDDEVHRVIKHWKEMGKPDYLDPERLFSEIARNNTEESNGSDDALFLEAGRLFIRTGMASVSYLQRRLKLGYTRAARLMDMLEEQGIVGSYEGSKPRQVLITLEEFEERFG